MQRFDVAVIGAGMAGASLAARLAGKAQVIMLEAEDRPGYHATGRSAAFWTESYGGPLVLPLTAASEPDLRDGGFLTPRGALTIARREQEAELSEFSARFSALGVRSDILSGPALSARIPGLRHAWSIGAFEPDCCDIDVAGLHQHYLGAFKRSGGRLLCHARLVAAQRAAKGWALTLESGETISCDVLVNAAGAWADQVAVMAGARPLGIQPYRRTVAQLGTTPAPPGNLPLVLDLAEKFYFKPESGRIWLSPHDETPCAPSDAAPEEIDVATAVDRFEQVVDWRIDRIEHRWAGLRSFAPDRLPVYGFDPVAPGLFWCAGQGGFGIQTAPAASELASQLLLRNAPGEVDPTPYLATRFG